MKTNFAVVLIVICLAQLAWSNSCNKCRASELVLSVSLDKNPWDQQDQLHQTLDYACEITFPLFSEEQERCRELASGYIPALLRDLTSENSRYHERIYEVSTVSLCNIVGACALNCCTTAYEPEQIHLAYNEDPTQMVVMWVTSLILSTPQVAFWDLAQNPNSNNATVFLASASSDTFILGGWEGIIYTTVLTNLVPGTEYYYQILGESPYSNVESARFGFVSASNPSSAAVQPRNLQELDDVPYIPGVTAGILAFYGDMDTSENSQETAEGMAVLAQNSSVQAIVHAGDISYADGDPSTWDDFFRMIQPFASIIPVMTAPGNHEAYYEFSAYYHRLTMPVQASGSQDRQYYSFNYEKMHIITWSVEQLDGADLTPTGRQYQWLENDLIQANANRDIRPWVILVGHRPLYCTSDSSDCTSNAEQWRSLIEPLINQYHVDVVIQAHKHDYERTYPVYNNVAVQYDYQDPQAPTYFVAGTGGKDKDDDWMNDTPNWSAVQDDKYGYLLASAADDYSLQLVYISKSWNVRDSCTIVRTSLPTVWSFPNY